MAATAADSVTERVRVTVPGLVAGARDLEGPRLILAGRGQAVMVVHPADDQPGGDHLAGPGERPRLGARCREA
jgi:hypothetical protein